ncbi:hypothetical protein FHS15_003593 [Paenibacillus castaneae]|uniref:hypothetical protein n=1 Tax=Paenibacillus castaneae TaxID=474957 RepID=UPI000C9CA652|nr:hypothetical protein [Paenibacillus castaneae]NIK78455.1 hypothetical protein [Paenibacillus castaneae]
MVRTTHASIAIVVAIAMMVGWLLTGCTNKETSRAAQLIVDGTMVDGAADVLMYDEKLMVSPAFVENVFHQKIEWLTQASRNDNAYY